MPHLWHKDELVDGICQYATIHSFKSDKTYRSDEGVPDKYSLALGPVLYLDVPCYGEVEVSCAVPHSQM
jgi:hypothetical protein